ncbi:uncharacterized protein A4U43_C08F17180 [Asparagus officinalis]|nr:uncharacterized protein A4U43_C08F17180 [Asparagus officinalis]
MCRLSEFIWQKTRNRAGYPIETRGRQTSQETLILSRVMPEANPKDNENVSLSEAQNVVGACSVQSELIQGSSDHSDEYMHASKPNTPN